MKLLLVLQVVWCLPDANCTGTRRRNAAHSAERECCPEVGLALGRRGFRTVRPQIRRHALGVGWNSFGQQGDGTTNNPGVPHQVLGAGGVGFLTNLSAILGGETHNAALRADGTVWDWGRNFFGELRDGSANWGSLPDTSAPAPGCSEIQPDVKTFLPPKNA